MQISLPSPPMAFRKIYEAPVVALLKNNPNYGDKGIKLGQIYTMFKKKLTNIFPHTHLVVYRGAFHAII